MKSKHLLLFVLTCILITSAFAQPVIKKQKTIGASGDDEFTCMDQTKDGGLIVGGFSPSNISGEKTANSRGRDDYWVIKLDRKGKIEWDKTIGGDNWDILTSLKQTSDGGYILGGSSYSNISGEKTENNRGDTYSKDYWVVKLDASGAVQWDKTIGGSYDDELTSLQQTSDGGYILGGTSVSNISGEKTANSVGGDYWVVKLNASGAVQWDKTIGGSSEDNLTSLQKTSDGGYILGGYSWSNISGDKTENNRGAYYTYDYWVVKLDASGVIQWDKTIGGNSDDELTTLQQTSDGGYILGGASGSNISGEKSENKKCGCTEDYTDFWVVKLDASGVFQWDKTIGGNQTDYLTSLQQTSDGGYILGGNSESNISGEKTENSRGGADYWVVKIDNAGNVQWDKTIGGGRADYLRSVKRLSENRYLLGGSSYSKISGDKIQSVRGGPDYWLVDLFYKPETNSVEITSAGTDLNATQKNLSGVFTIYPNPAKDILRIQNSSKATYMLTNQAGKILITKTINGNGEINVSHFSAGLYYLKNNETGVVQKIVITK